MWLQFEASAKFLQWNFFTKQFGPRPINLANLSENYKNGEQITEAAVLTVLIEIQWHLIEQQRTWHFSHNHINWLDVVAALIVISPHFFSEKIVFFHKTDFFFCNCPFKWLELDCCVEKKQVDQFKGNMAGGSAHSSEHRNVIKSTNNLSSGSDSDEVEFYIEDFYLFSHQWILSNWIVLTTNANFKRILTLSEASNDHNYQSWRPCWRWFRLRQISIRG